MRTTWGGENTQSRSGPPVAFQPGPSRVPARPESRSSEARVTFQPGPESRSSRGPFRVLAGLRWASPVHLDTMEHDASQGVSGRFRSEPGSSLRLWSLPDCPKIAWAYTRRRGSQGTGCHCSRIPRRDLVGTARYAKVRPHQIPSATRKAPVCSRGWPPVDPRCQLGSTASPLSGVYALGARVDHTLANTRIHWPPA